MDKKKEEIETQNIQLLLQDFLTQEKIKQNLLSLSDEIKGIFSSKISKSLKSLQKPLPQAINPQNFEENDEIDPNSKEFSLLYQEYKDFIAEKSPVKTPEKNSQRIVVNQEVFMKKSRDSGTVVERYENIKEKFDTLAKRFEKYVEIKASGEEEKSHEFPLKKNENFLENIEEEKAKSSEIELEIQKPVEIIRPSVKAINQPVETTKKQ